jgi:hypothetical protein
MRTRFFARNHEHSFTQMAHRLVSHLLERGELGKREKTCGNAPISKPRPFRPTNNTFAACKRFNASFPMAPIKRENSLSNLRSLCYGNTNNCETQTKKTVSNLSLNNTSSNKASRANIKRSAYVCCTQTGKRRKWDVKSATKKVHTYSAMI